MPANKQYKENDVVSIRLNAKDAALVNELLPKTMSNFTRLFRLGLQHTKEAQKQLERAQRVITYQPRKQATPRKRTA